jgi:hypothetical protein
MTENHFLYLDAVKCIEAIRQPIGDGYITHHLENNQTGAGTKVFRHLMESNPGLDVTAKAGQKFLDFRRILDPVLNVDSQYDVLTILHCVSPFVHGIETSVDSVAPEEGFKSCGGKRLCKAAVFFLSYTTGWGKVLALDSSGSECTLDRFEETILTGGTCDEDNHSRT